MKGLVLLVGFLLGLVVGSLVLDIDFGQEQAQPIVNAGECSSLENSLTDCQNQLTEKEEIVAEYFEQCGELEQEVPEGTLVCDNDYVCWRRIKDECIKNAIYLAERDVQYQQNIVTLTEEYTILGYFEDEDYEWKLCKYTHHYKMVRTHHDHKIVVDDTRECVGREQFWDCNRDMPFFKEAE